MYDKESNIKIIDYIQAVRGFNATSRRKYLIDLNTYSEFNDMSLEELLNEAEEDEDNNIRMRRRRISQRLFEFQDYLEKNPRTHAVTKKTTFLSPNTINGIMASVKMFYTTYDIQLPMIRTRRVKKENIKDVLLKKEIRAAIEEDHNKSHKAIITILASSGLDVDTLVKITVGDYLKACRKYTYYSRPEEMIKDLANKHDCIPTFVMERGKTHYEHVFFFSPEACDFTNKYLLERLKKQGSISKDELLFPLAKTSISRFFSLLNDKLEMGWTSNGTRRRFRPHAMRSFFATTLSGTVIDGMMVDSMMIEFMLGHTIPPVTAAYYKKQPDKMKEIYVKLIPKLTFMNYTKVQTIQSPEYKEMEAQLRKYKELEKKVEKLEKLESLYAKLERLSLD